MNIERDTWAVQTIRKADGAIVHTRDGYLTEMAANKSMRRRARLLNARDYTNKVIQTGQFALLPGGQAINLPGGQGVVLR